MFLTVQISKKDTGHPANTYISDLYQNIFDQIK